MTGLRYALSGAFVIALAAGLVLMIVGETRRAAGRSRGVAGPLLARPATWFGCAGLLFVVVVILTILFPVDG